MEVAETIMKNKHWAGVAGTGETSDRDFSRKKKNRTLGLPWWRSG